MLDIELDDLTAVGSKLVLALKVGLDTFASYCRLSGPQMTSLQLLGVSIESAPAISAKLSVIVSRNVSRFSALLFLMPTVYQREI